MIISRDKKRQVRLQYRETTHVDCHFPPRTWRRLRKAYRDKDKTYLVLWAMRNDLDLQMLLTVLKNPPK